jgi:hypothetical protein
MDGQREPSMPYDDSEPQTGSTHVPETRGSRSRRMLLLGIGFLCVLAAGVSAAMLSSPSSQTGYIAVRGVAAAAARRVASPVQAVGRQGRGWGPTASGSPRVRTHRHRSERHE